jgi:hypothetical protein
MKLQQFLGVSSHLMSHAFCRAKPFGVRQLAAAFENGPIGLFFKRPLESGSKLPHSEGALWALCCGKNYAALTETTLPGIAEAPTHMFSLPAASCRAPKCRLVRYNEWQSFERRRLWITRSMFCRILATM